MSSKSGGGKGASGPKISPIAKDLKRPSLDNVMQEGLMDADDSETDIFLK